MPTIGEVVLHWADIDAALGGTPATDLKLEGGFSRADLIAARDVLEALNISIEDLENAREIAAASRDNRFIRCFGGEVVIRASEDVPSLHPEGM